MSKIQKRLRDWFRRRGYHTGNTPTDQGFWLESPVMNNAGSMHSFVDEDGMRKKFCWEYKTDYELDRFCCDYLTIKLYRRKHIWKRDPNVPFKRGCSMGYSHIPSDDFTEWEDCGYYNMPIGDVFKLSELCKVAYDEWLSVRKTKNHLNFMERISKSCGIRWIGRNSSYDDIKWTYSNERLRKERGYATEEEYEEFKRRSNNG